MISRKMVVMFAIVMGLALAGYVMAIINLAQSKRSPSVPVTDILMVRDSFTDSDRLLNQHVPEMGGAWAQVSFARNAQLLINGNQVAHSNGGGFRTSYNAGAIFNDDQFAEVTINRVAQDGGTQLYFRLDTNGTEHGYALKYDPSRGVWVFLSITTYEDAGCGKPACNEYEEGTPYTDNFPIGQSRRVRIVAVGNTLTAIIAGSQIQMIDTDHPHGGHIAISLSGHGFTLDDFVAGNVTNTTPTPSPTPTPSVSPTPCPADHWHLASDTPTEKIFRCY